MPQPTRAAAQLLVDECTRALQAGGAIVIVDEKGEGTFAAAASEVSPHLITTMLAHGRGMVSVCLTPQRCRDLNLHRRGGDDPRAHAQPYVTSVDAAEGVTTGISAADRARTIQVAADPGQGPEALREPGHLFVLRAVEGGVMQRAGHTEASIELASRAGLTPAAVICELLDDSGALADVDDQIKVCESLGIPLIHTADLRAVLPVGAAAILEEQTVELRGVQWRAIRLQEGDGRLATEHTALVRGDPTAAPPTLAVTAIRPLALLLGHDAGGLDPAAVIADAGGPAVLIALGPKRDLRRATEEVTATSLSHEDQRSVATILRALDVSGVRPSAGLAQAGLADHGIRVVGARPTA